MTELPGRTLIRAVLVRYLWVKEVVVAVSADRVDQAEIIVVTEDKETIRISAVNDNVEHVALAVFIRLDEINYNRMVAADTEDWYDAPTGGLS